MKEGKKWYDNKWITHILLIIFPPAGLYALWKSNTIKKWWKVTASIIVVLMALGNLAGDTPKTEGEAVVEMEDPSARKISKQQMAEKWPFTVDSGVLSCVQYGDDNVSQGVVFEANGVLYGVNGMAKSFGKNLGYKDIVDIWADDLVFKKEMMALGVSESKATVKIGIGDVLQAGLKLCN